MTDSYRPEDDNPYRSVTRRLRERQDQGVQRVLADPLAPSPDEEAAVRRVSQQSGLPEADVRLDLGAGERVAAARRTTDLLRDSPRLREWISDSGNAAVARDDVETLSVFERVNQDFWRWHAQQLARPRTAREQQTEDALITNPLTMPLGLLTGGVQRRTLEMAQDPVGTFDLARQWRSGSIELEMGQLQHRRADLEHQGLALSPEEEARLEELRASPGLDDYGPFIVGPTIRVLPLQVEMFRSGGAAAGPGFRSGFEPVMGSEQEQRERAQADLAGEVGAGEKLLRPGRALWGAGAGVVGAVGGFGDGYLSTMYRAEMGNLYDSLRQEGVEADIAYRAASEYATWATALEFALDATGLRAMGVTRLMLRPFMRESALRSVGSTPAMRAGVAVLGGAASGGTEEASQRVAEIIHQDLARQESQGAARDVGQAWRAALTPEAIQSILESGYIGLQAGAGIASVPATANFALDMRAAQQAERGAGVFEEMTRAAQSSKLNERGLGSTLESAVGAVTDSQVYIDADRFIEHFQSQGVNAYQAAEEIGISQETLARAVQGSGQIEVPTSVFAARVLRLPQHASLAEHARITPDAATSAEAKMSTERLQAEVERIVQETQTLKADNEIGQVIEARMRSLFDQAEREGGPRSDISARYAKLAAALPRTLVARARQANPEYATRLEGQLRQLFGEDLDIAGPTRDLEAQAGVAEMEQRGKGPDAGPVRNDRWEPPEGVQMSERQRSIAEMAANGASNEWIANEWETSPHVIGTTLSTIKAKLGGNAPWERSPASGNRFAKVPIEAMLRVREHLRQSGYPANRINRVIAERFEMSPANVGMRFLHHDRAMAAKAAQAEAEASATPASDQGRRPQPFDLDTIEGRQVWFEEEVYAEPIPGEAADARAYGFALDTGEIIVMSIATEPTGSATVEWTFLERLKAQAQDADAEIDMFGPGTENLGVRGVMAAMARVLAILEADMAEFRRDSYVYTPNNERLEYIYKRTVNLSVKEMPYQTGDDGAGTFYLVRDGAEVTRNGTVIRSPENADVRVEWPQLDPAEVRDLQNAYYERLERFAKDGTVEGDRSDSGRSDADGRGAEAGSGVSGTGVPEELDQSARGERDLTEPERFWDDRLTDTQNAVVRWALTGRTNAQIADALAEEGVYISGGAVAVHLNAVKRKTPDLYEMIGPARRGAPMSADSTVWRAYRIARELGGARGNIGIIAERLGITPEQAQRAVSSANYLAKQGRAPAELQRGSAEADRGPEELNQSQPAFYSAVERALEQNTTARAPGSQWWATISKAQGVKKEELQWLGLEDWLKAQEGPVAREDVLAFVRENGVRVEETVLGTPTNVDGSRLDALQREILPLIEERDRITQEMRDMQAAPDRAFRTVAELREAAGLDPLMHDFQKRKADYRRIIEEYEAQEAAAPLFALDARHKELSNQIIELEAERKTLTQGDQTRWSQYTLPGGENYREVLLRLPHERTWIDGRKPTQEELDSEFDRAALDRVGIDADNTFRSSHFDQPNILAHVRFNERTDANGKRTLFIEEVQSDWHQAGRERGYTGDDEFTVTNDGGSIWRVRDASGQRVDTLDGSTGFSTEEAARAAIAAGEMRSNVRRVPDAPFKNNAWASLAMKRMIRWASENGFEQVAWTRGEQQLERFNLARAVDEISVIPPKGDFETYTVTIRDFSQREMGLVVDKSGAVLTANNLPDAAGKPLSEVVGLEMANKIMGADRNIVLAGEDLKVGGSGMRAFYDKILPNIANDLGKKFGARVGETQIAITPEAIEAVAQEAERTAAQREAIGETGDAQDWRDQAAEDRQRPTGTESVHSLPITPEMREAAMEGQALFQGGMGATRAYFDYEYPGRKAWGLRAFKAGEFGQVMIRMTEAHDLSTFLHEFGHLGHTILEAIATDPQAPAEFKAMWQSTLDWWGIESQDQWMEMTREQRSPYVELWARSFEGYLMEGKAPSLSLRESFAAFKAWLTQIYRSVFKLDHKLNPQIRDVFERLLATDQEMAEARASMGADFSFARAAFKTDAEFATYQQSIADAREAADSELRARVMDAHVRKDKRWWRSERERVRPTAEIVVDSDPARRAYEWLAFSEWRALPVEQNEDGVVMPLDASLAMPEDLPVMSLSARAMFAEYGEGAFDGLPVGLRPLNAEDVDAALDNAMALKRQGRARQPARLWAFIKNGIDVGGVRRRGIKDEGLEIRQALGSGRNRPGLINNVDGLTADEWAMAAWENGYFGAVPRKGPMIEHFQDDSPSSGAEQTGRGAEASVPDGGARGAFTRRAPPINLDLADLGIEVHTPVLYRETNVSGAERYLPGGEGTRGLGEPSYVYMATAPELALGQGSNRGVLLEFDAAGVEGTLDLSKPAASVSAADGAAEARILDGQGLTQRLRAIRIDTSIPVDSGTRERVTRALQALRRQGWTQHSEGRIHTYERPLSASPSSGAEQTGRAAQADGWSSEQFWHGSRETTVQAYVFGPGGAPIAYRSPQADLAAGFEMFQGGTDAAPIGQGRSKTVFADPEDASRVQVYMQSDVTTEAFLQFARDAHEQGVDYAKHLPQPGPIESAGAGVRYTTERLQPKSTRVRIGRENGKFYLTGLAENDPQRASLLEAVNALAKNFEQTLSPWSNYFFDLGPQNFMARADGTLVINDPVESGGVAREMFQEDFTADRRPTPTELLDALIDDLKNVRQVYSVRDEAAVAAYQNRADALRWFDARDINLDGSKEEIRAQIEEALTREAAEQGEGWAPDDIAPWFGFESGDEMIQAMRALEPRAVAIDNYIEKALEGTHGDPFRDGAVAEAARLAAHIDAQSRKIELELEAIQRATNGKRTPVGRAAKAYAEQQITRMTVKQVRGFDTYLAGERRAARNAMEAVEKGDMIEAGVWKQRQLINFHLYRLARNAAEEMGKFERYAGKFDREGVRKKFLPSGNRHLEQIDQLLETIDMRRNPRPSNRARATFQQYMAKLADEGIDTADIVELDEQFLDAIKRRPFTALTVEEVRGLRDVINNFEALGTRWNRVLTDRRNRLMSEVIDGMVDHAAAEYPKRALLVQSLASRSRFEQAVDLVMDLHASNVKAEQLLRNMDGLKANGPWFSTFIPAARAAQSDKNDRHAAAAARMTEILSVYSKKELGRMLTKKEYIPQIGDSLTRLQQIAVMLYSGTEYRRAGLMKGFRWDEQQLEAVIFRLTERDVRFAQDVWAFLESFKAESFALDERVRGVRPQEDPGIPVQTAFGKVQGGYFPIKFDPDRSRQASKRAAQEAVEQLSGGSYRQTGTKRGRLKQLVGTAEQAFRLDLISIVAEHVEETVHDISHRELVIDARRLISSERVRSSLTQVLGPWGVKVMDAWVAKIEQPRPVINSNQMMARWERAAGRLKNNATIVNMGLKVTTALIQELGVANVIPRTGILPMLKQKGITIAIDYPEFLVRQTARFFGQPSTVSARFQFIFDRSDFMRQRMTNRDRDVRDAMASRLGERPGILPQIPKDAQDSMLILSGLMDMAVSGPAWLAGYETALAGKVPGIEAGNEQASVDHADSIVATTQSGGAPMDLSAILASDNQFWRLVTMFMSWANTFYNQMFVEQIPGVMSGKISLPRFTANMMFVWFAPALITMWFYGRAEPQDGEDEDEFKRRAALEVLIYPLQTIPILRDALNAYVTGYGHQFTPVQAALEAPVKLVRAAERGDSEEIAKQGLMVAGYAIGLPSRQMWITGEGATDIVTGEEDVSEDPVDSMRELFVRDTR